MEKAAYDLIHNTHPSVLGVIQQLLDLGKTPTQIADTYSGRDVAFAGLVELAAAYMKESNEQIDHEQTLDHEQTISDARNAGCP